MTAQDAADIGELKIKWAESHAPVLSSIARDHLPRDVLRGVRIAVDLPIEPKTALMCLMFKRAGAEVVVGTDPLYIHTDVAGALARHGVIVKSLNHESGDGRHENLVSVLETGPHVILDGSGNLGALAHSAHPEVFETLRGVSEETTTGVRRYRRLHANGLLKIPVFAANDARMKHLFDNRYGTGQSGLTSLLSITNLMLPGKRILIVGYGWVGKGLARFASAFGARILVTEVDPVRGVEALADGHVVLPLADAVTEADVVITASGTPGAFTWEHISRLKDGAILENVGGSELEIDVSALIAHAAKCHAVRPFIEEFTLRDGRRINLLGGGKVAFNVSAAAEGHPIEIMDLTFSIQALCVLHMALHGADMPPAVYPVPSDFDDKVARAKLACAGMAVDDLTQTQRDALSEWDLA
jgi:adenosylhomocysteinase